MTPTVFRAIAIDPLHALNVQNLLTDWKKCKKKKIRTNEGGYVYFYPIRKTFDFDYGKLKINRNSKNTNMAPDRGKKSLFLVSFAVLINCFSIILFYFFSSAFRFS